MPRQVNVPPEKVSLTRRQANVPKAKVPTSKYHLTTWYTRVGFNLISISSVHNVLLAQFDIYLMGSSGHLKRPSSCTNRTKERPRGHLASVSSTVIPGPNRNGVPLPKRQLEAPSTTTSRRISGWKRTAIPTWRYTFSVQYI